MKKLLKILPLTLYSTLVVLFVALTDSDIQYDSNAIHVFLLIVLAAPLITIGQIYAILNIPASLPWTIPLFFLLDLLILYVRKGYLKILFKKLLRLE